MKVRRKIWSIPIAALALVLMLVGALAVTGIVQAEYESVTLTDPAGNEVGLRAASSLTDDPDGSKRAQYTFDYDNSDVLMATDVNFTITVSSGREIGEVHANVDGTDIVADADEAPGHQVPSALGHDNDDRTQIIRVLHDVVGAPDNDITGQEILIITLTLENSPPTMANRITDRVTEIPIDPQTDIGAYLPVPTTGTEAAFSDVNADALAFTALSRNINVATVSFGTSHIADAGAPPDSAVGLWWNSLIAGDAAPTQSECNRMATSVLGLTPVTTGGNFCQRYNVISDVDGVDYRATITQAFHWNMLTGQEMYDAAVAGGLSGAGDYKVAFKDLTSGERSNVLGLYTKGVLAAGTDVLSFGRVGSGMSSISIKVSDASGRFIGGSVGQTFTVKTPLSITDPDATVDEDGLPVEEARATHVYVQLAGVAVEPADAEILTVTTDALGFGGDVPGPRFFLTGDDRDRFYVDHEDEFGVVTRGSQALEPRNYNFTITAQMGDVSDSVDVIVRVGHSNQPPEVVAGATTEFNVVEQGVPGSDTSPKTIHNFMANFMDPDRERTLMFSIAAAGTVGERQHGIDEAFRLEAGLRFDGSDLKTGRRTFSFDENVDVNNVHYFVVTATDGSGASATQSITLSVVDAIAPTPTPKPTTDIEIPESTKPGVANSPVTLKVTIGDTEALRDGPYELLVQSPDGLLVDDTNIPADDDDEPDIGEIWAVEEATGKLYLKEGAYVDFEGDESLRRYVIAVRAGLATDLTAETEAYSLLITDVNEAPEFEVNKDNGEGKAKGIAIDLNADDDAKDPEWELYVLETANQGDSVGTVRDIDGNISDDATPGQLSATDQDGDPITYTLEDWDDKDSTDTRDDVFTAHTGPFAIGSNGNVTVDGVLDADAADAVKVFQLRAVATDNDSDDPLSGYFLVTIYVVDSNEPPVFDERSRTDGIAVTIDENTEGGYANCELIATDGSTATGQQCIFDYHADDADDDHLTYKLTESVDAEYFAIDGVTGAVTVAAGKILDFEVKSVYEVNIEVEDSDRDTGATDTLDLTVTLNNLNDNDPVVSGDSRTIIGENTPRDTLLATYRGSDADGDIDGDGTVVSYSLRGAHSKSFQIVEIGQDPNDSTWRGELRTLESLDYDSGTPCPAATGCDVTVVASDGEREATIDVTIVIINAEDSVSTLDVRKANPVPGTSMGAASTALAGTKVSMNADVPERPGDLPNTYVMDGKVKVEASGPMNFVETGWANWGTVLRIEVTSQSPADARVCGNGNQCVVISINSDSADDTLKLEAYRMDTPAGATSNENKFVAAVMLVEFDMDRTDVKDSAGNEMPVYAHPDGSAARLQVDEEDEIEIEFGNLRGSVDVENEAPEIANFAPEHEAAFSDADVEYTFTVTDSHSGLPEPEDLPDVDGDDEYTPVVALISKGQCETADHGDSTESKARRAKLISDGFEVVADTEDMLDGESMYCPGDAQSGEYDAGGIGYGFAPIRDDKDFSDIDDGFDVETTIVLRENRIFYVSFIACDNAGNCSFFDPDGNDDAEELARITVDTEVPVFVEARTGLTWDSTDSEYDDDRSFIQVIFNDLTTLNTETVEIADFVVEGHSIKDVHIFENPDDEDATWGRYGDTGHPNKRGIDRYRDIENSVFVELEDELLADETPDVTIVPNGIEDAAGNEQDDGDHEADDWISPSFTIVSIVSTRETTQEQVLAGDDDEVTVVVTTDERLDSTRPTVTVTYVKAPAGSIDTKGTATCDDKGDKDGTRERGEIISNDNCADSGAATGGNLNNSVEKVSNTEWIVTITEPKDTGYYNFRISGKDRSPQENPGSEGVSPDAIVTDFFDADGDVNVDDAIFFEGDINLPKPQVRVSGVGVQDNEADVEFRSPLFVELDFARNHATCGPNADSDERMANCTNENSEYAEDNFDDIVVTSFVLDGVDLTDSVKTTDNQSFLVSLESISIGDHTAEVQAVDQAGNVFEDTLEIDFEVNDRDPFEKRLSPGWNLVSLPGEPADSSIAAVFGPGVEVRTVYSYDPVIPGGWMVAVRETLDSDWQGDLTEITGQHGYWVLSDAIQDWEVSIPRLAGGASGTGTPIQPPVIPMYAGWNLIPVTDVSGSALSAGIPISATVYLNSLDDGLDLARVLGYDTIRNEWFTVLDMQMGSPGDLSIGSGYWVFVREAAALVPGGVAGVGGSGD